MNQPLAQSILIVCVAAGLIQPLLLAQTPVSGQAAQQSGKSPVKVFIRFLEYKLADIRAVVAAELLAKLQAVTIVLDLTHGKLRSMQYHPSAGWLEANGYATNLVKCVHIPEAADLPTPSNITEQPWVVLHELAHAYHDQVLGFEEPAIREEAELIRSFFRKQHNLEVLLAGHILLRMRNVYITPHSAFNTREAVGRILDTTIENIQTFARGEPANIVSKSRTSTD